jgi:HK97 family phage major capsid protein
MNQTPEVVEASAPVTIPTNPMFAEPRRQFRLPAFSEYIAAWRAGGADFAQLNANIRAASPTPYLSAAAGDVTTGEADGILPEPILGPIYDAINAQRPLVSTVGTRAMPASGKVFIRPKIKTRTQVAEQATELSALASRSFETEDIQVTKETYGGTVLLSEQVIDWSQPSMLDAVLADLAAEYAMVTEGVACDAVYDALTNDNKGFATDTEADPEKWIEALYACAAQIAGTSNYLPTHILVHPEMWAAFGSLVDGDDRPIFPYLAPSNASGTQSAASFQSTPLGLSLVVSKEFDKVNAKDLVILFNARALEFYETPKGSVSVDVPSQLGVQLAFRGYFAPLVIDDTKISFFQVRNQ